MLRPPNDTRSALLTLLTTPHLRPPSRQPLLSDPETGLVFPTHLAAAQEWLTLAQPQALAVSGQAPAVGYQIHPRPVGHHRFWDRRRNTNPVFQIWAGWGLGGANQSGDDITWLICFLVCGFGVGLAKIPIVSQIYMNVFLLSSLFSFRHSVVGPWLL